jgi:hypothetical protein
MEVVWLLLDGHFGLKLLMELDLQPLNKIQVPLCGIP